MTIAFLTKASGNQKIKKLTLPGNKVSPTPASTKGHRGPKAATRPQVAAYPPEHRDVGGVGRPLQEVSRDRPKTGVHKVKRHDHKMKRGTEVRGPSSATSSLAGSVPQR